MPKIEIMSSKKPHIEAMHKIGVVGEHFLMHIHNKFEIYVSVSGNSKYFVGQKIYDVNAYDVFLFNNKDMHKIHPNECSTYERYVIMFPPNELLQFNPEVADLLRIFEAGRSSRRCKLALPAEQKEEFMLRVQKLIACNDNDRYSKLKQNLYIIEILIMLNEIAKVSNELPLSVNSDDERINAVMQYIRENCAFPLSLDDLSKQFYLNKYYLCRLFKNKLGVGINSYIESCRLSNAVPLLQEGRSVSEVALKTGFGSDAYFISTFKHTFGMPPKKYIKELNL